jgi:hypothetical protein
MKKTIIFSLLFTLILAVYGFSTNTANANSFFGAAFSWKKTSHDFNQIQQGVPVTAEFEFTNTGDAPLIITNAQGSCGCTVPSYPKEPIAPGATGKIKAQFNAAAIGVFNKTVTITANAGQPTILKISGEVIAKNN